MSGGLMSCVRENSPPLDMDMSTSGPLSLPEPRLNNASDLIDSVVVHSTSQQNIMSSTPLAAHTTNAHLEGDMGGLGSGGGATLQPTPPNTEQQKRRRFHPLRNLRRIFRRRTITAETSGGASTSAAAAAGTLTAVVSSDLPTSANLVVPAPTSSTSEKNLRSATLSSITSVASASSPSSPLTHQQLHDAYLTQSLPKSKSSYLSLLSSVGVGKNKSHDSSLSSETNKKSKHKHKNQKQLQLQQQQQQQLQLQQLQSKEFDLPEDDKMYGTTTQTSATYHHHQLNVMSATTTMSGTASSAGKSSLLGQRNMPIGVAVFPSAMSRNFFADRQKLRSVGDSSQDLDSGSGNDSGTGGGHISAAAKNCSNSGGEMSDSQRSLSEGRLIDSDYSRDGLSQSHDSVFSEAATASSLSIVLKAELADVLRKRRNRPDASDEDLGLPRSPASPQRRAMVKMASGPSSLQTKSTMNSSDHKQSADISSLSMLSMNSIDGEDMMASSSTTTNTSMNFDLTKERSRYSRASTLSSISMTSADILRHRDSSSVSFDSKDEVDLFSNDWQRLSHSAARHKMAIRPNKKKGGPSRQHRRTLETSIPEANEDLSKLTNKKLLDMKDLDAKAKTRSLPPGVNTAKLLDDNIMNTPSPKDPNTLRTITTPSKNPGKTTKFPSTSMAATSTPTSSSSLLSTTSVSTSSTTPNSIFGFRALSSKANAIFENKMPAGSDSVAPLDATATNDINVEESNADPGFLRRLMHRNSKRSISKANAGDDEDTSDGSKQSEPKKLYVGSNTVNTSITQDVTKSEFSYINTKNENLTEVKREINNDKAMAFNSTKDLTKPEEFSPSKPKSGPAARQRYLPQNISNENLNKPSEELIGTYARTSTNDALKSTSVIQEITKQQQSFSPKTSPTSPTKPDHHFEKKPKIVGLSAFQQKISRSNDAASRATASQSSLDQIAEVELCAPIKAQIYEQKSRKSVEKSKSFRAYGEEKTSSAPVVHNNMPSLPDLSMNVRVPFFKDFSSQEREQTNRERLNGSAEDNERKSYSNYDLKARPLTPTKPPMMGSKVIPPPSSSIRNYPELESPTGECTNRSSFVSVLRKSSNFSENLNERPESFEKVRPSILPLKKEKSMSEESVLNSPSTANVTLREKSMNKQNLVFSSGCIESKMPKDLERQSAPQLLASKVNANGTRTNSTRRTSSVTEAVETNGDSDSNKVPEFMKIQLNRVDPMRLSHSHVVLAKNVKEPCALNSPLVAKVHSRDSSPEKDEDFRRLSSESVDIHERCSPEMEKRFPTVYHEAINKQPKLCIGLPPKSPIKKTGGSSMPLPTTPTTPPTPTINEMDGRQVEGESHFKLPEPQREVTPSNSSTNSLSLQERRRLFMSEENKTKVEEIKYERKKSIHEECSRKSIMKSDSMERETSPPNDNVVILRKKSFASSSSHLSMNGSSCSSNNNGNESSTDPTPELMKVFARRSLKIKDEDLDRMMATSPSIASSIGSASHTSKKFNLNSTSVTSTSSSGSNPNIDSDKENQSASEEKLDKLTKKDSDQCITITKNSAAQTYGAQHLTSNGNITCGQRNSVADFRHVPNKVLGGGLALNNNLNNNQNNSNNGNNNNNNNNSNNNSPLNGNKPFLPPIKTTGFRPVSMERNNNIVNSVNLLTSPAKSTTLERPSSIKLMGELMTPVLRNDSSIMATLGITGSTTTVTTATSTATAKTTTNITKTFERSATVSEFKGIHQRRAEWEQRAKEALK